ncbi:hypothetical protein Ahia01_000896800 [Argonauta hians]
MCTLLPNNISFSSIWSVFLVLSAILITEGSIYVNGSEPSKKTLQPTKSLKAPFSTVTPPTSTTCLPSSNSSSCINGTVTNSYTSSYRHIVDEIQKNKGMLLRTLYVLIAITSIVVIYFIIKSLRLRRRRSKSKKYGIITTPASDLEMAPLDQGDDDDEDMTVFELNGKPK